MNRKTLLLIFNLLFTLMSLPGNSQTSEVPEKLHAVIKFYPLSLVDGLFPTVQPAIEFRNSRFGVQFTWGFNYNFYNGQANPDFNLYGNRYRFEFRRYSEVKNKPSREKFRGVVLFATNYSKAMEQFQFSDKKSRKNFFFEKGTIHKKVYGIAYKSGWFIKLYKNISLEFSPEIGVRVVTARFTDFIDLRETEWRPGNNTDFESTLQGTKVRPHPGIVISINYRLF